MHDLGNDEDELGNNLAFTDLGAVDAYRMDGGLDHTCAVLLDGTVKCWGKNFRGALGLGDFRTRGDSPGEVSRGQQAPYMIRLWLQYFFGWTKSQVRHFFVCSRRTYHIVLYVFTI